MKKFYILLFVLLIVASSIYFYMNDRNKKVPTYNSKQTSIFQNIGVVYHKPNILSYSEFLFFKTPNEMSTKKFDGTAYYFEETDKYKDQFVMQSFIEGKRVFVEGNKSIDVNVKKEKSGISARYQDDKIDIIGYNDGVEDSTLEIIGTNSNQHVKLTGVIVQIHYDSHRNKAYIYSDKVTTELDSIYVIDVNTGKADEYSLENPDTGMAKNFQIIGDKIVFSTSGVSGVPGTPDGAKAEIPGKPGNLVIFDKNNLSISKVPLPHVETLGIYSYKEKYIVTFLEGYIVELDKQFKVIKEHNLTKSKYPWFKTRIHNNYIYALTPGSQTDSDENILFAYDLENNMEEHKMILPSKKAYALDFIIKDQYTK